MGKADQYRHYAAECIRLAQKSLNQTERETLLGMAEAWRRLAERRENSPDSSSD
jgi:hypothetical protein